MLKNLISRGNKKLSKNTAIFNLSSATDCPMKYACAFGLSGKCYAMKAERRYPQVLPYRRRQEEYWRESTLDQKVRDFTVYFQKRPKLKYLRINEAGDIRNAADLIALEYIAIALHGLGVTTYTYTHNHFAVQKFRELFHDPIIVINISLVEGEETDLPGNKFRAVKKPTSGLVCPGVGCMELCRVCAKEHGKTIEVAIH